MAKLMDFTNRACDEARSVAKRGRDSNAGPGSSSSLPSLSHLGPMHRTVDDDPPARKAARAVASATPPDVAAVSFSPTSPLPLGSARRAPAHSRPDWSTGVSVAQYRVPPVPVMCPVLSDRRRPTLPVSLLLPRFAAGFRSVSGYHTVALGRYPIVPSVTGVPVVDTLL